MKVGRIIGWFLLGLAVVFIGHEALNALEGEPYRQIALGELWFRVDQAIGSATLNVTQAVIQRYISAWLWQAVIQNILLAPTWIVLAVIGGLVLWLCRVRKPRGGIRGH